MTILVMASGKGGVSKTTTSVQLAVCLITHGVSVALVPADKNRDIPNWNEKRAKLGYAPVPVIDGYGNVEKAIDAATRIADVVIVDCAGHDSEESRLALLRADIFVTPVKPSSDLEVESLTDVTATARKAQANNPTLKPYILLTRIKHNRLSYAVSLTKELKSDPVWLPVLKTRISELDVFEDCTNAGAGVHEAARASSLGKAKAQIELLAAELNLI
ncbi:ParA family protein [Salmonella enterica]|nr:ParA family protein [Salmonella enterica]